MQTKIYYEVTSDDGQTTMYEVLKRVGDCDFACTEAGEWVSLDESGNVIHKHQGFSEVQGAEVLKEFLLYKLPDCYDSSIRGYKKMNLVGNRSGGDVVEVPGKYAYEDGKLCSGAEYFKVINQNILLSIQRSKNKDILKIYVATNGNLLLKEEMVWFDHYEIVTNKLMLEGYGEVIAVNSGSAYLDERKTILLDLDGNHIIPNFSKK